MCFDTTPRDVGKALESGAEGDRIPLSIGFIDCRVGHEMIKMRECSKFFREFLRKPAVSVCI